MSYSDLFDGEKHWLGLDCEPGWQKPYMQVISVVDLDPQIVKLDDLESPLINFVAQPVPLAAEKSWAVEEGWQAFAVMVQYIGELMSQSGDNDLQVEQQIVRNPKTWDVVSSHHLVVWKGDDVEC